MDKLYFALVDTPGIFASLIRRATGLHYIHVVLALDEKLEEAYSVGRRNPAVPIFAGFEKEELPRVARTFPRAGYKILSLACTPEQKHAVRERLRDCYTRRFHYHYCLIGLPFILWGKPFYQKRHYTCSSFIARLLEQEGIQRFDKHFSLVTPRDFFELPGTEVVFEGVIGELLADTAFGEIAHEP